MRRSKRLMRGQFIAQLRQIKDHGDRGAEDRGNARCGAARHAGWQIIDVAVMAHRLYRAGVGITDGHEPEIGLTVALDERDDIRWIQRKT